MCKSKKKLTADVIEPKPKSSPSPRSRSSSYDQSSSTGNFLLTGSTSSYLSDRTSLSSLRQSLPEQPHIYDFSEIRTATRSFASKPFASSSSSSSWRCNIRNHDAVVIQRKLRRPINTPELIRRLSLICQSHYASLISLRGVSISGDYIYLVYDYVSGVDLATALWNPRNPSFTILANWASRIQVASDVAHGLNYIHHLTGSGLRFVHNHIKSTSIIVQEPNCNAKICHFGTAELCGESEDEPDDRKSRKEVKVVGTRGYMAPELQSGGLATQKCDVYAFGVMVLELLSGQEAVSYKVDDETGKFERLSVIDTARTAVSGDGGGLRGWVDRRLKDSYPVDVAEKLTWVGLECVEEDPNRRPDMGRVSDRISRLYLESETWANSMGRPVDITVSFAPR